MEGFQWRTGSSFYVRRTLWQQNARWPGGPSLETGCWWRHRLCGPGGRTKVYTRKPHFPRGSSSMCTLSSLHPVCLPHVWHHDPGPCAGIICIFVFPLLPGWEHFSLSASQSQGAGSQLAQMCCEGHGVQEEGHGVNTACGPAHEPNKTSRPFAHSLPFLYLSLIKLCKEMS